MEENVIRQENQRSKSGVKITLLFVLLTFPFFQIDYLIETVSWMGKAYTACQVIAAVVILFLLFKDRLFKKIPRVIFLLFAALLLVMCIASVTGGGSLKRALEYSFATLILCLFFEYGILKDLRSLLIAEMIFFGALTVLNFLSILVFKNGMYYYLDYYYDCWLLGFKSGHIPYQMAFLFFAVLYAALYNKKRMYIVYIGLAIVAASNWIVKNRTALIILIPIIIIAVFPKLLKFTKVLNVLTYTGIGLVMNLLFVVFRRADLFSWLIVDIMHKRVDLTHRTEVWDKAFEAISGKPVLGHGYQTFVFSDIIETTHNEFVEVLYKTGIIGLVIFLAIIGYAVYKLFKSRKILAAQWVALFLGAFFLMFVMEQYAFSFFFYLFLFTVHSKDLERLKEEQERRRQESVFRIQEQGRIQKSARNFLFTIFASIAAILIGLLAQKLFIQILGLEYAGLNGLFTNVITMLGIVDLGIGEAVIFNLYKPIKENDRGTILSLMRFYRKAFHIIAGIVAVIGVCLIPVLPYIAKTTEADVNTTLIYLIFLADVVLSYFLSYKRAILYADQKNYYISIVHMVYLVGMNTAQLLMLYFTHNYYAYLITKVVFRVLENIVITAIANRQYPFLREKKAQPLQDEIKKDIKKKTGALFFHKIGTFVVNGTDNILISVFFSLTAAGLYSNYYLVIDALTRLFNPALAALTPSVGNMLVSEDKTHVFRVFRRIRFMNFWIASFAGTSLLVLIQPFIRLWFGAQYVLSYAVVITLTLQFFQLLMRGSYNSFQDAAGIFYENRFVPLVESALNLVASIILLKIFGLAGVFAGTIVSSLVLWCFSYPKFVYKKLFQRSFGNYAKETLGYLGVFLGISAVTALAVFFLNKALSSDGLMLLVADAVVCFILSNGLLALVFCRSDCFKYFIGLLKKKSAIEG